jgi:hypothetical protein
MATMNFDQVAETGKKLYEEEFKEKFATGHTGEVLAIEVKSKTAYLGKTPLEALSAGEAANQAGLFYLVRIGSPGVYHLRSTRRATRDRLVS